MRKIKGMLVKRNPVVTAVIIVLFCVTAVALNAGEKKKENVWVSKKMAKKGYLGVSIQSIPSEKKEKLGVKFGIKVTAVSKDSAAEKAGIKKGDVIQYFGKEKIRRSGDLTKVVRDTKPGTKVEVKLVRDKKLKNITVKVGDYYKGKKLNRYFIQKKSAYLGVYLEDMSKDFGEYFGVKNGEGALIKKVVQDTPAEEFGFKSGDVLVKIAGMEIKKTKDVHKALAKYKKGDKVEIVYLRHKKKKSVKVELDEQKGYKGFHFYRGFGDNVNVFDLKKGMKGLIELQGLKHLDGLSKRIRIYTDKMKDGVIHLDHFYSGDGDDVEIILKKGDKIKKIKKLKKRKEKKSKKLNLLDETL